MISDIIRVCIVDILLIFACIKDIQKREIPNEISAAAACAALIGFDPIRLWGLSVAAFFFFTALFIGNIGGGDVKLFAALSIVCGFWGSIALLVISHASMLIFYAVKSAVCKIRGKTADKHLPFAPFITFGFMCSTIIFNTGNFA